MKNKDKKEKVSCKVGTFPYYAQQLGLGIATVKRYGKEKCESLLFRKGIEMVSQTVQSVESAAPQLVDQIKETIAIVGDTMHIEMSQLDEETRRMASLVLNKSIHWIRDNVNHPDLSIYQKAQINLAIVRTIAGSK